MTSPEVARAARRAKAEALATLGSGALTPAEAVLTPPGPLSSAPVYDCLVACPGLGPKKCRAILEGARVWPLTPMANLTLPERRAIIQALPHKEP